MRKVVTISFFFKSGSDASLLKRDMDKCHFKSGYKIPARYSDFGAVITTADIKELYADLQKNLSREILNFTISYEVWDKKICGYGDDEGEEIQYLVTEKTHKYTVKGNQYVIQRDNTHLYTNDDGLVYKGLFAFKHEGEKYND